VGISVAFDDATDCHGGQLPAHHRGGQLSAQRKYKRPTFVQQGNVAICLAAGLGHFALVLFLFQSKMAECTRPFFVNSIGSRTGRSASSISIA
jgi:hypothetical protein